MFINFKIILKLFFFCAFIVQITQKCRNQCYTNLTNLSSLAVVQEYQHIWVYYHSIAAALWFENCIPKKKFFLIITNNMFANFLSLPYLPFKPYAKFLFNYKTTNSKYQLIFSSDLKEEKMSDGKQYYLLQN